MEELFRFLLRRPAQAVADPSQTTVEVKPSVEYNGVLKKARQSENPRAAMRQVAAAYLASPASLKSVADLGYGQPLLALVAALAPKSDQTVDELEKLINSLFAVGSKQVVADPRFGSDRARLSDVLVSNAILGTDGPVTTYTATRLLRGLALLERAAAADPNLYSKGGIKNALARTLLLPSELFPIPGLRGRAGPIPAEPAASSESGGDDDPSLVDRRDQLIETYRMLTRLSPQHFAAPAPTGALAASEAPDAPTASIPPVPPAISAEEADPSTERTSAVIAAFTRPVMNTLGGSTQAALRSNATPMLLKPEVTAAFTARQQTVLAARNLDLTRVSVPIAAERLSNELQEVENRLAGSELSPAAAVRIGKMFLPPATIQPYPPSGAPSLAAWMMPTTHGTLTPAGIGDLLVVRQFLKRYEATDLSYVENILKGEFKERMHRRERTTEETITVETEIRKEEERDQQSTERFELRTETSQIVKEDASLKAGLTVSGSYGPSIEFTASADFALNTSIEQATKVATDYSKEVTNRATSRVFERRREERILKTIEVFEEKNTHGVDNKAGADNVIGQYQWLEKVYEAQIFNYGKRMLFDIMLPEPAAFWLYAVSSAPPPGNNLVKPPPFTLTPADLNEWNYMPYVAKYQVSGVTPPPDPYITVAKTFDGRGTQDNGVTKTAEIPVSTGYRAIAGTVTLWYARWSGGSVDMGFGGNMHRSSDNDFWYVALGNEEGTVAFEAKTWKAADFIIGVEVQCQRTQGALDDWKLKTHAAIMQAYLKMLRDYEEQLAALQVQAAQEVQGRNPDENARLIRVEIKKGATSVFTAQQFDAFGAITTSTQGYPQPDLTVLADQGRYIRFFEQALDWEQMMFFFYPYFWGRKYNWPNRALLQDVDPLFADFIRAGSARVVLAVRPGFEHAIAHFLDTGEIWDGGDLPPITSPLYVSIIEEIRERDAAPGTEVAQGDPWDVRLPTTLIKLRPEASLPAWQKNAQGEWVPV